MDGQRPPNDPHNNNNAGGGKPDPQSAGRQQNSNGVRLNENGEMDMIGNELQDQGLVIVMFLVGIAGYLLRERCIC